MRARILMVEDDPAVLASVRRRLDFEGYEVHAAADGVEAVRRFEETTPDLVLLDVMLPGLDGLQVAERLREHSDVPILMLTARDGVRDRVAGFERGADDYLVKPFAIEELLARIRALLRRASARKEAAPDDTLRFEDLELSPASREVTRRGRRIELTPREFGMLEYFMRHPRQVLTRDQVFEAVWGSDYMGGSNVIDVNIKALRDKLESEGEPRLIQTVRGVGYCLREY